MKIRQLAFFSLHFITALVYAQSLPKSYPAYILRFSEADSISYSPLFDYQELRDRFKNQEHGFIGFLESIQIEKELLNKNPLPFLERQKEDTSFWNIQLLDGRIIEIKWPEYYDYRAYNFVKYYEKHELILFRIQYSEGHGFVLIDRTTGSNTYVYGPPKFSPSNKFFISYIEGVEPTLNPKNGIQLWTVENGIPKKLMEYDPPIGPTDIHWIDDYSFRLGGFLSKHEMYRGLYREYEHYKVEIEKTSN